jgi:hypothetical protein
MSQKTVENGCWILASQPLGVPEGPVYWTIDVLPTKELAGQAKGAHGTVVGSLGKVWLLTIGEKPELRSSGTRVTQIGTSHHCEGTKLYRAIYGGKSTAGDGKQDAPPFRS